MIEIRCLLLVGKEQVIPSWSSILILVASLCGRVGRKLLGKVTTCTREVRARDQCNWRSMYNELQVDVVRECKKG